MRKFVLLIIIVLLSCGNFVAQSNTTKERLEKNAESAAKLLQTDPEKMLQNTKEILIEAK